MATEDITYEMLIAYVAGELPADAAARVEAHLAQSPADADTVDRILTTIKTMRADDTVAPPAETLARAKAIFKPVEAAARPKWLDRLERIVAELVFDSRAQPALAGVRGEKDTIQLAYESAVAEVDLELLPGTADDPETWTLMGQISLPAPVSNIHVALVAQTDQTLRGQAQPDEHGVFKLQLSPGMYDVVVQLGEQAVVLPGLNVNG